MYVLEKLLTIYNLQCFGEQNVGGSFGRLETSKQLEDYEDQWHQTVFLPSLKELPEQVRLLSE